jgi:hypothetical protein
MTQRPASKIVLPQFTLTEVCAPDDEGASLRQLASTGSTEPLQYAHRPAWFCCNKTVRYDVRNKMND